MEVDFSIIVPVYNSERTILKCLESLQRQTMKSFEVLVIDDGSSDNSRILCDKIAEIDSRFKIIHQKNVGVSSARNTGLAMAKGCFIAFIDSDDTVESNYLEILKNEFVSSNADVVFLGYKMYSSTGAVVLENVPQIYEDIFALQISMLSNKGLFGYTWVIRFCEDCANFAEDLGFVLEYMLFAERVVSISYEGYCYRIRLGSMMNTSVNEVKLNCVNEVSLHFMHIAHEVGDRKIRKYLPIFHFLIMYNQYYKVTGTQEYPKLGVLLLSNEKYDKWEKNTRRIFRCRRELIKLFGKYNGYRILLLSHYCLHKNWKLFSLETILFYRVFKNGEEKLCQ